MAYKITFSKSVFADCMMNLPKTVQRKLTSRSSGPGIAL